MARSVVDLPCAHQVTVPFGTETEGLLTLLHGSAEICGASLRAQAEYRFSGTVVVTSFAGCRLDVVGHVGVLKPRMYDSAPYDIHTAVEADRCAASSSTSRVLVIGATDTGKSTLCRTLLNLATAAEVSRSGQRMIAFCDFDVGQNSISCPGTMNTVFLNSPLPVEAGFEHLLPLSFVLGEATVTKSNQEHYLDLVAATKRSLDSFDRRCPQLNVVNAGAIINTMGWTTGLGLELIEGIIQIMSVTHIVVAGGDTQLLETIKTFVSRVSTAPVRTILFRLPVGIAKRDSKFRKATRAGAIRKYFTGTVRNPLVASRVVLPLKAIKFVDCIQFLECEHPPKPLSLCAVSHSEDLENCRLANIAGFVVILDVGSESVCLLSPSPAGLPGHGYLVVMNIAMQAEHIPPF